MIREHRRISTIVCLVAIVGAGLFLRLYGIPFGLPYLYHQDEPVTVGVALKFGTGELNPHYFHHPHLLHYILFVLYGCVFLGGYVLHIFHSVSEFRSLFFHDPSLFYLSGRVFCAILGATTLLATYGYGKRLSGHLVGILSSLFLATSFLHVRHSHYVRHDIPVTLMVLISSLFILKILEYGRKKDYLWAGFLLGLTLVTNWNGAIVLTSLATAVLLRREALKKSLFNLFLSGGASLVAAFVGSPFLFLDPNNNFKELFFHFSLTQNSAPSGPFVTKIAPTAWGRYLFHYLRIGMGWPLELLALAGILWFLIRHQKKDLVFLSFPILYFCFIGKFRNSIRAEYILPILPFLYISAAGVVVRCADYLRGKARAVFLGLFTCTLISLPTIHSMRHDYLITQKDTRTLAKEWVEQNIPPRTKIAMEKYIRLRAWVPPILETNEENLELLKVVRRQNPSKGKMREGLSLAKNPSPRYTLIELTPSTHFIDEFESDYNIDELLKKKVEYVILSSFIRDFHAAALDPPRERFYKELSEKGELVKRFSPFKNGVPEVRQDHAPHTPLNGLWELERPGPVIEIYRLNRT